jgi:hypothetical protein
MKGFRVSSTDVPFGATISPLLSFGRFTANHVGNGLPDVKLRESLTKGVSRRTIHGVVYLALHPERQP